MVLTTVVLDLDDTLIASARARVRAYKSLRSFGIDPGEAEAINNLWWPRYYRGECSLEELRLGRWVDLGLDPERAAEVDELYRRHHHHIRSRHGARHMLEELSRSGVRLILLSNAGIDYVRERVAALRVDALFHGIIDAAERSWKPHPDAFNGALEMVGASPAEAAMVGDNLEADIEGALSAGFGHAVWLSRRKAHPDPRVFTCTSLRAATCHLLPLARGRAGGTT